MAAAAASASAMFSDTRYYPYTGKGPFEAMLSLPENHIIAGNRRGQMYHWDLTTNTVVREWKEHTGEVKSLVMMEDGRMASASWDTSVMVWDLETGACVAVMDGHTGFCSDVAVLSDGRLASSASDRTVMLWDVRTETCTATLEHTDAVRCVAALPDGRLASGSSDGTVKLWDLGAEACVSTLRHRGEDSIGAMEVLPDGRLAVAGSYEINLWNLTTGAREARWDAHDDFIIDMVLLPNGLLASCSEERDVRIWDSRGGARLASYEINAYALAPTLNGGLLCSVSDDNELAVLA